MIKLGIFGDSFGDDYSLWTTGWKDVGPSWIDYLRDTGKYEVTNFCARGTNTYFSKKLFDQHHHEFDKIILMETFPYGRIDCTSLNHLKNTRLTQFFNIQSISKYEKEIVNYNFLERRILKAVKNYYMYVMNQEYDTDLHNLWLEDMRIKFPSIIVIPCFFDTTDNNPCLMQVLEKEKKFFNLKEYIPAEEDLYDARKCHMSEENNLIFGKKMEKFLEGDPFFLSVDDFVNPTKDFAHYFRKKFF